jgi:hypothetical protein
MSEPTVKAIAPIRSACGPTCTRTSAKLAPRAASILPRTASGNGRPPPEASPSGPASTANAPPAPCRCTIPCRPAEAGIGGAGRRAAKAGAGGPGGRAAVLAWIAGGGGSLAGTDGGRFGSSPKNDPWITFAVMRAPS